MTDEERQARVPELAGRVAPELLEAGVYDSRARSGLADEVADAVRRVRMGDREIGWDLGPLWLCPELRARTVEAVARFVVRCEAEKVAGVEGPGVSMAVLIASRLQLPLVLLRRTGRPSAGDDEQLSEKSEDEAEEARLEAITESVTPGERVCLVNGLLDTGRTLSAAARLVERLRGRVVGVACLAEVSGRDGRWVLRNYNLMTYMTI